MKPEHPNKVLVAAIISGTAVIIAAIIGLGAPFAQNLAARYLPPFTPTSISNSPSPQVVVVTATYLPQGAIPTPTPTYTTIQPNTNLCFGQCWEYDDNRHMMTWTRTADGTEDVWQPAGPALQKIRSGYIAVITTSVPGEIFGCVLTINGKSVKNSCDGVLYPLQPGTYQITSSNNDVGGFRWCPIVGYGWRKNGGECK